MNRALVGYFYKTEQEAQYQMNRRNRKLRQELYTTMPVQNGFIVLLKKQLEERETS